MAEFLAAHKKTAVHEGGYANVAADRGGETYKGIARNFWPNWPGWAIVDRNKPLKHNAKIKDQELESLVNMFYKRNFWDKIAGDAIDDQETAFKLYDFAVTSGQPKSIQQIQKVLGLPETGKITQALIEAINNPAKHLIK